MNKQELQTQYDTVEKSLEADKKELRDIENQIDGYDKGDLFIPKKDELFYHLHHSGDTGEIIVYDCTDYLDTVIKPVFRDENIAKAYAQAFQVILEMRACGGIVEPTEDEQTTITINPHLGELHLYCTCNLDAKIDKCFSPCFDTESNAQAAIDKVGEDRILQAMKTLAGVK